LYEQGFYEDSSALLGLAVKIAQRLGLHRDPSHFVFSPWVAEMRRRIWNYLSYLDARSLDTTGAECSLSTLFWDTQLPRNANDKQWEASRFATPSSLPRVAIGFTDMTFVILRGELTNTMRNIIKPTGPETSDDLETFIKREGVRLHERFSKHLNLQEPLQRLVGAVCEMSISRLHLMGVQRLIGKGNMCIEANHS
jgi:Fungal specific transcription factor domain